MSCRVLVVCWLLVSVAAELPRKRPPSSPGKDGEPILRPFDKTAGTGKQPTPITPDTTGRHKMSFLSSAVVMGMKHRETLGIDRHGIVADSGGRRRHGKMGVRQDDSQSDTLSHTGHSDKLDRMGIKESALAPINRTSSEYESPSQRCCMPTQFEAILASHIGTIGGRKLPRSGISLTLLSYDYTNKKLHFMYPDMHGEIYRILFDFSKKPATSYTVRADGSCQCAYMRGIMVPWCTPASEELTNGLSLTGSDDNVNMFVSPESPISMTLARKTDCIFLMTSRTSGNPGTGHAFMSVTTYMNVTIGISNPATLKIPYGCNSTCKV